MHADLRRLSAVSLVTALTLGVAVGPAFAADEPANPLGIGRAVTNDAQRGTFQVTAWTDAPQAKVTAVSAKVRQGGTVLAEIDSLPEDTARRGTFALPVESTLKLTEDGGTIPALGTYAIDVTATDSAGNTVTRTDAGTLDFTLKPQLRSFSLGTPSWSDRNVHPKGTLVGVQPGSNDEVPLTGRTVSFDSSYYEGAPGSAATDETGAFEGQPIPAAGVYAWYTASYTENSTEVHGRTTWTASSNAQTRSLSVTARADKTRAVRGETVTVTGRVTDRDNSAPVADQPVKVRLGGGLAKTVGTDADGRFTAALIAAPVSDPNNGTSESWQVESADPYQWFSTSGRIALPLDSTTTVTGYKLATDARLTVTGELRSPFERWAPYSSMQQVVLEQSPDGKTGWKRIASTDFYNNGVRTPFSVSAWNKGGWFRVRHVLNDTYAESVGKPFHVVRTDSRVQSLKASPDPVRKGATVTVTGSLQHLTNGAWRGLGSQSVSVWFKPWGKTTWKQVATGKSAANGSVAVKTKASADGWYQIRYYGDGSHFQATSGQDWVDVR
ncbi:hypothetical protein [Streptomyces sp. NPDC090025]|uniref:hypothetical protein n=1 Tax=Streptomyces sp. NPDC090025 TaxID=3365922 RepID=UPI0038324F7C